MPGRFRSTTSFQLSCYVDNTPPVISISTNPDGTNGWYRSTPATVSASGDDGPNGSGTNRIDCLVNGGQDQGIFNGSISFGLDPSNGLGAEGDNVISCTGHDVAGNQTPTAVTAHVYIDDRPPIAQTSVVPQPNGYGWNNSDVTVTYSCNDPSPGSGLTATYPQTQTFTDETDGTQASADPCVDVAGNSSPFDSNTIKIDKTAPENTSIDSGPSAPVLAGSSMQFSMSAQDALSGVVGYRCYLDGVALFALPNLCASSTTLNHNPTPGPHTFTAQAVDAAGNVDPVAASYNFTVLTPVTVNVTGRQTYGGSPTFDTGGPLPDGVSGTISCATVDGGTAINTALAAGSHPIDASSCTGLSADATHYLTVTAGDLTVNKLAQSVTVSASQTYGGAPSFDVGGALPDGVSGTVTCTTVDGGTPIDATLDVGSYTIDGSSCTGLTGDSNHDVDITGDKLTVAPAPITITASDGEQTYGDTTPPVITPDVVGLVNGQDLSALTGLTCSASTTTATHAGTYQNAASCSGANDPNYSYQYVTGAVTVDPAPLAIGVAPATRRYGDPDPAFTVTYDGLVNGDQPSTVVTGTPAFTANLTREVNGVTTVYPSSPTSPAGSYRTRVTGLHASSDYTVTHTSGTMTVTRAPLTISVNPATRLYGQPDPTFALSYAGFANGEGPEVLDGTVAYDVYTKLLVNGVPTVIPSSLTSPRGTYDVRPSGLVSPDYAIRYVSGHMTVTNSPDVTSVAPSSGATTGGTAITLLGTQFTTGDTVVIGQGQGAHTGALAAQDVTIVSPTKITATTPGGAKPGTWHVFVVTYDGRINHDPTGSMFTYMKAASAGYPKPLLAGL